MVIITLLLTVAAQDISVGGFDKEPPRIITQGKGAGAQQAGGEEVRRTSHVVV